MSTMRAKLQVQGVSDIHTCGPNWTPDNHDVVKSGERLNFMAVGLGRAYNADGTGDEDNTYARWSPQANFDLVCMNPALFGQFKVGDKFYVDFTPADVEPGVQTAQPIARGLHAPAFNSETGKNMGPKAWLPEDDSILIEIYRNGKGVINQLDRLPGRTHRACIGRGRRLGLCAIQASAWSEAEDAIIRKGYRAGTPMKKILQRLPGRTLRGVAARVHRLGLSGKFNGKTGSTYSWIEEEARRLLEEGEPLSCAALTDAIGCSKEGCIHMLRRVHGKSFYIADWERCGHHWVALWLLGKKPDEPKPERSSNADNCQRYRARRRILAGGFDPFATLVQQVSA